MTQLFGHDVPLQHVKFDRFELEIRPFESRFNKAQSLLIATTGPHGRPVAVVDHGFQKMDSVHAPHTIAWALLFKSSPKMLEVLKDIAAHLKGGAQLHDGSRIFAEDAPALDVLEKLIAEAEGKQ